MNDRARIERHLGTDIVGLERIGEAFGFAGRVYRVRALDGSSVVVKIDTPEAIAGEMIARRVLGDRLGSVVPAVHSTGDALLVMEDIHPAEQGDAIEGCTPAQADAVLGVLGHLHAGTWEIDAEVPRWQRPAWTSERWLARVDGAQRRHPHLVTPIRSWLIDVFPAAFGDAAERLGAGPHALLHGDVHLDNVLWRPDGSAVVLDWNHVETGPPAIDVAALLVGGCSIDQDVSAYVEALGDDNRAQAVTSSIDDALLVGVRGAVGWVGSDRPVTSERMRVSRDLAIQRVAAIVR